MNIDIPEDFVAEQSFARAFNAKKADILARVAQEPPAPTLDVNTAATVMLTVAANVEPLMADIQAQLPLIDMALLRDLAVRAEALLFTQSLHSYTFASTNGLEDAAKRLLEERRILSTEVSLAVMRGVLPEGAVTLSGSIAYQDMAQDVRGMCTVLLANWDAIGPAIGGRRERITEVMALADQFVKDIAAADQIKDRLAGPAALRAAAFQLALESYREIDRVVSFLRFHHDDAGKFVPTIYGGGRPKRKSAKNTSDEEATPTNQPAPVTSAATTGGANVPANKVTPTGGFGV